MIVLFLNLDNYANYFMEGEMIIKAEMIYTYVPYLLLPYGKSIQVIEPLSLKEKIIETLLELIKYYKV